MSSHRIRPVSASIPLSTEQSRESFVNYTHSDFNDVTAREHVLSDRTHEKVTASSISRRRRSSSAAPTATTSHVTSTRRLTSSHHRRPSVLGIPCSLTVGRRRSAAPHAVTSQSTITSENAAEYNAVRNVSKNQ